MLIISRKPGESFYIGDNIEVTIFEVQQDKVRIGISAPNDIAICRKEIKEITDENFKASKAATKEKLRDLSKLLSDEHAHS